MFLTFRWPRVFEFKRALYLIGTLNFLLNSFGLFVNVYDHISSLHYWVIPEVIVLRLNMLVYQTVFSSVLTVWGHNFFILLVFVQSWGILSLKHELISFLDQLFNQMLPLNVLLSQVIGGIGSLWLLF